MSINGSFVPGKKNNAFEISSKYNYVRFETDTVRCATYLDLCIDGLTITFWFQMSMLPDKNASDINFNSTEPIVSLPGLIEIMRMGNEMVFFRNPYTTNQFTVIYPIQWDQWVHYAITWDNPTNKMSLYVDGQLYATPAETPWPIPAFGDYYMMGNTITIVVFDEFYIFEKFKDAKTVALLASQ